jgi:hypothetical protein
LSMVPVINATATASNAAQSGSFGAFPGKRVRQSG